MIDAKAEAAQIGSLIEERRQAMKKLKQSLDKTTLKKYQEANAAKSLLTNLQFKKPKPKQVLEPDKRPAFFVGGGKK